MIKQILHGIASNPDEAYPRRILESFIDECIVSENPYGMDYAAATVRAMNNIQAQRNIILKRAIQDLYDISMQRSKNA